VKNKVILTDCDEVLLSWQSGFEKWMLSRGHKITAPDSYNCRVRFGLGDEKIVDEILQFNHSEAFGYLEPVKDSVKYVRKLYEHGFQFIVLTSCTVNPVSKKYRKINLFREFALNVDFDLDIDRKMFLSIVCLPCGGVKDDALREFAYTHEGCYWIEDNAYNADIGHELGFDSILIKQPHNELYRGPVRRFDNWKNIYDHIIESEF